MKEQVVTRDTNRREMLKLSGMGVLGGVAVTALAPQQVQAADPVIKIPYASWIHGLSMQIEFPDRIISERRAGYSITVDNKSGFTNWYHFAIPTPVFINDIRMRVDSVMLRFRTGSVDAIVRDVHVYDGEKLIAAHNGVNLTRDNLFTRFVVPDTPLLQWGIGISIGVGFGVEMMSHRMEFIAAGADLVINKPV
jgi:hypothetical protein